MFHCKHILKHSRYPENRVKSKNWSKMYNEKNKEFFSHCKKNKEFFSHCKKTRSFFHTAKKTKVFFIDHFWFFFEFCPDHLDSPRNAIFFSFADSNFCCAFFSSCNKQLKNVLYYETKILHQAQQVYKHSNPYYYQTKHLLSKNRTIWKELTTLLILGFDRKAILKLFL